MTAHAAPLFLPACKQASKPTKKGSIKHSFVLLFVQTWKLWLTTLKPSQDIKPTSNHGFSKGVDHRFQVWTKQATIVNGRLPGLFGCSHKGTSEDTMHTVKRPQRQEVTHCLTATIFTPAAYCSHMLQHTNLAARELIRKKAP